MAKVILNGCFGGYGWSKQGMVEVLKRKGATNIRIDGDNFIHEVNAVLNGEEISVYDIDREDPVAIQVLEEMGSKFCSDGFAKLYIEEYNEDDFIPGIDEYDGMETLELIPRVTEERIHSCRDIDEVIKLLKRLKVITQE